MLTFSQFFNSKCTSTNASHCKLILVLIPVLVFHQGAILYLENLSRHIKTE